MVAECVFLAKDGSCRYLVKELSNQWLFLLN